MIEKKCPTHDIPLAYNADLDIWQCVECNRIFMEAMDALEVEQADHTAGHPHGAWPDCGWCSGRYEEQRRRIEAWMTERRAEWDAQH